MEDLLIFNPYKNCIKCTHGIKIEIEYRERPNPLKYKDKGQLKIRTIYRCKLNQCELKEV